MLLLRPVVRGAKLCTTVRASPTARAPHEGRAHVIMPTKAIRILLLACSLMLALSHAAHAAADDASAQLHALFDEDWSWTLQHDPEFATYYGEHRYDDRLDDHS